MSVLNGNLTESIVAASVAAESDPSESYLEAARFLSAFSAKYADADDVASVARLILASVMESGLTGSLAAGSAVKRAAQWLTSERGGNDDPMRGALSTEDEYDVTTLVADDSHVAPDAIARWSARDDLGATWDALDDTGRAVMEALRHADSWRADKPSARAIAMRLYGKCNGYLRDIVTQCLDQTMADMREVGAVIPDWRHAPCTAGDRARDLARDTTCATSGTASLVVRTLPNGTSWVTLADRSSRVDLDGVATVLAHVDTLPAYMGGTGQEVIAASLTEPRALMPATRPCGVAIGMVHGSGMRAGGGAPTPRPVASRKRKRDGGVGSPMVPAKG